ncbi:MAG TPA: HisA/HisF-related TIM barrel protein [Gemmatimonadales bacterium]|nr:HisA/HisF-related TIM barrel protein [Gemmatimonadales bacterium]
MSTYPLIPVLDLAHGQAVHAIGGRREEYRPVESVLAPGRSGNAMVLARAYRERVGATHCYLADLDAIQGKGLLQSQLLGALADPVEGFGPGLLVDAGAAGIAGVKDLLDLGMTQVIAGLESLDAWSDLEKMVGLAGSDRVLFSLDLHQGRPVHHLDTGPRLERISTEELVDRVVSIGVAGLIVIDLADVGSGAGPSTEPLLQQLQLKYQLPLYAGGGVRDRSDVAALLESGASGVLVGTAVHNGELLIADC